MENVTMQHILMNGKHMTCSARKRIPQNMAFWSNVQLCHEIHNIRWEEHLQQMNFTNFTQLEHYVRANPLPQMEFLNINDEVLQCEKSRLDYIALHHLPTDAPDGYAPADIFGDGNCFPRTCSYLVGKNEDKYTEFCVCIVYELVQNKDIYLNDTYVSKGARDLQLIRSQCFLSTITPCLD